MKRIAAFVLLVILMSGVMICFYSNAISAPVFFESKNMIIKTQGEIINFISHVDNFTENNKVTFFAKETIRNNFKITRVKDFLLLVRTIGGSLANPSFNVENIGK